MSLKRIYHTWDKWECYPAGFYENSFPGKTKKECEQAYKDFLSNKDLFSRGLGLVIEKWKNSCEHYLTNEKMNRIAWLGQAAMCALKGIPACYRAGYFLLSENERRSADYLALEYLNKWLVKNNYQPTDLEGAGVSAQANIY